MKDNRQMTVYGSFPSDFKSSHLAEVCDADAGIQTGPFGSQLHQEDYVSGGVPIITVEHLRDNRICHTNLPGVSQHDWVRLSRYTLQKGDIVFSRVGSVDRRALVREEESGWLFSGRCLRVRPDRNQVDPGYLSYFFGLPSFREYVRSIAFGATMPSLNTQLLSNVPVYYPSLNEQRAIAHVLGTLDDKIELNRRMNETLEAMARALFKSWFIDFDPVHAKAEGRDTGLPPDVAALFPDSFEDSELGRIPRGWEVKTIGDLANVVGGGTPSTKEPEYWSGGSYLWATPKDLSGLSVPILVDTAKHVTDVGLLQISSGLLPTGTVLLSSRAPIGYLAIAERPTAINQGFIAMLPKDNVSNMFLLLWAEAAHDDILSRANGSTFLEINKANFRLIPVVSPTTDVMAVFGRQARELYDRLVMSVHESGTLATLRDALLPRLLSGRLRVGSVEQLVEARS